ncbi:NAD(+) synthase, partial [Schaalia odontolytica]|uniref:NAD(+) synthase n=1 Tax=Schaalia odontolytica TaxID=1660 RepID=UPI0028D89C2E
MNFHSLYDQGFARVAAVTLPVHPARPFENAREIIDAARELDTRGVAMAVFPELCVSGYAIDDLFLQDVLLDNVEKALADIVEASADLLPLLIVGAPLRKDNALYNCAVAIHRGRVLGIVPKSHLPNYREFYEKRHFVTMPPRACDRIEVPWGGTEEFSGGPVWVPFGQVLLSADDVPGLTIGIEICEDMWVPVTPATELALAGATVLANLSASPITVGRGADRELMVRSVSARCSAAYVYTAAGMGESSTDLAWDGEAMIYEAGDRLAIGERFQEGAHITIADVDLERLRTERKRQNSFTDNAQRYFAGDERMAPQEVEFTLDPPRTDLGLERPVNRFPFVPNDPTRLEQDCYEAYNIQVAGLVQRLRAIGNPKIVIGVSGGLDSTHALVVASRAMDLLGRPRTDILCYTLPGFATSERTKKNATLLCQYLGTSFEEIDIRPAATQMLADIGHPYGEGEATYDVTFENVQAGLRTDYLFRLANHLGGIVLGTGDLSELALGWCT